jgi:hypothetical protein
VKLESTAWYPLDTYTPVREGWYEVQLASGETAFAKFGDEGWTEKPMLIFTHWRGLSANPGTACARSGTRSFQDREPNATSHSTQGIASLTERASCEWFARRAGQ